MIVRKKVLATGIKKLNDSRLPQGIYLYCGGIGVFYIMYTGLDL